MPAKDDRLRIGVLGCGPIAQAAHFEACVKARNAELYAICDVADDLRERMAATHGAAEDLHRLRRDARRPRGRGGDHRHRRRLPRRRPRSGRSRRASMCSARSRSASRSRRPRARARRSRARAGAPGRPHEALRSRHRGGEGFHRRRDGRDAGAQGLVLRLDAPLRDDRRSAAADRHQRRRAQPAGDPKADRQRYYMLAHGSHLVDTARFLGGAIERGRGPAAASASAPVAGSSTSTSPTARSAISI